MYEKLLERRSVRKYKPEQITEELLDAAAYEEVCANEA